MSNAPLREAFLASDVSAHELAVRLGWMRTGKTRSGKRRRTYGDDRRVRRTLGIVPEAFEGRAPKPRRRIHETTARRIVEALGLDPVDVGL